MCEDHHISHHNNERLKTKRLQAKLSIDLQEGVGDAEQVERSIGRYAMMDASFGGQCLKRHSLVKTEVGCVGPLGKAPFTSCSRADLRGIVCFHNESLEMLSVHE